MNFKNKLHDYINELVLILKKHYVLITVFVIVSVILQFVTVPFLSVFLMLILMFYLSKTEDYKNGFLLEKIFQFVLFFVFLIFFVLLFAVPSAIFLLGYDASITVERFVNSPLIKNFINIGAYISLLFIFAPYRIFDANVNVFKALSYSFQVIVNNFLIFIIILLFLVTVNILTLNMDFADYFVYLISVILTAALYRLNVKNF